MLPNYRRCLSCGKISPKEEFWRIVRIASSTGDTAAIKLDQGMGRSAYLCQSASCLMKAKLKNRLGRSLKASVPEEIFYSLSNRLNVFEQNLK